MKGLILKDVYIMLHAYKKNFILILIVYIGMGIAFNSSFFLSFLSWTIGFYSVGLLTVDKSSKWDNYAACLPISRAQVVSAKFIMLLICLTGGTLLASIGGLLFYLVWGTSMVEMMALLGTIFMLSLGLFGISMALSFKYGPEKGRIIATLSMASMGALAAVAGTSLSGGDPGALASVFAWLDANIGLVLGLVVLLVLVVFVLSWVISVRIYKSLEF